MTMNQADGAGSESPTPPPSGTRYEIESVLDFLKVPTARRPECLKDFASFLEFGERGLHLLDEVSAKLSPSATFKSSIGSTFTWIDDGVSGVSGVRVIVVDLEARS